MKVKDIMSSNIIVADKNDSIYEIADKMKEYDIGFLPIIEGSKIIGVLTDRDLCIKILANKDVKNIGSYIEKNMININEEENIENALEQMKKHKIKRLLVTNENKVTGILSLSDILQHDSSNILPFIQSIFENETNHRENTAEIDSFYL